MARPPPSANWQQNLRLKAKKYCWPPVTPSALQLQNSLKTPGWEHPEMVFTTETGGFCGRCRILRHLHGLLIKNDLPDCTVHSLRHTFASILINENVHIKAVSAILGHSSVRVTGDIYAHAFADYEARAAEAVSLALG